MKGGKKPKPFIREIDSSLSFQGIIINREKKHVKDYEKYLVSLLLNRTTTNALVAELCERQLFTRCFSYHVVIL